MATATRAAGLHGTIEPDFESVAERVGERSPRTRPMWGPWVSIATAGSCSTCGGVPAPCQRAAPGVCLRIERAGRDHVRRPRLPLLLGARLRLSLAAKRGARRATRARPSGDTGWLFVTSRGGGGNRTMGGRIELLHINGTVPILRARTVGRSGTPWYLLALAGMRCLGGFVSRSCPDRTSLWTDVALPWSKSSIPPHRADSICQNLMTE